MSRKKGNKYVEKVGLLGRGDDYHVYHMTKQDYFIAFGSGFSIGFVVIFIFFANFLVSLISGIITGMLAPRIYREYRRKKRLEQLRLQFKDALESIASSYSAGLNTMQAFHDACRDLETIYGDDSDIYKELSIICIGMDSNISIEKLLMDWAERCELEDVKSFAEVFEVCNRQGANLRKIVSDTRDIINEKIEVEMEIATIISGSKNELNIMVFMPVIIVLALRFMGGSTIVSNSLSNVLIKLLCLGLFVGAYLVGKKITDIKI